ncbi:MAG: DEAD/DEAH box helicase, partial [Crocinitomicaceae bacterium]|nr:DEAD/DEAH box helicase [Crocinitomicaceae bacterium]
MFRSAKEFRQEFEVAQKVEEGYLIEYDLLWRTRTKFEREIKERRKTFEDLKVTPNLMQKEALANLEHLRAIGKIKALLISATGTGKTYLSAFDVQKVKPKKFLFIVHRLTIAEEAMKTFENLLGADIKMGIYSGMRKELDSDYLFSTIQTISKQEHLNNFEPSHFEYIVIDESHRAAADSYQRIMNHFSPKFLLGMTATPERTDGDDIFKMFDNNIAYEIRLHRALSEEMLSPFHYYGVTDLTINDQEVDELTDFNHLTAKERVERIIETAKIYGCDNGNVRGLIFSSNNEISIKLSNEFNERGFQTVALTGDSSEAERQRAIRLLESDNYSEKLDYIFTVDIFNEGIDIPSVNQIIMLRPTQSAIIFVQQLGRGLR